MIDATERVVDDCVRLGPRETAAGRPFTDPAQTNLDLLAIRVMLAEIRRQVARAATLPWSLRPLVHEGVRRTGARTGR